MSKRTRGGTREANRRRERHARRAYAPVNSVEHFHIMAMLFGRSVAMEMAPVGVRKRHLELVRAAKRRWRRSRERLVCTGRDVILKFNGQEFRTVTASVLDWHAGPGVS